MSDLRDWNDRRLRWWLDATYPDRIAGRIDPETPMSRKTRREGSDPLKSKSLHRLDDPGLSKTDRKLLEIFLERLPAKKPPHYAAAARANLLDPTLPGGYAELERLELQASQRPALLAKLGGRLKEARERLEKAQERSEKTRKGDDEDAAKKAATEVEEAGSEAEEAMGRLEKMQDVGLVISEAARVTRGAYECVLDELDRDGFRLDVEPADRVKLRELRRDESRIEKARSIFVTERKKHGDDTRAIKKTATETGYSRRQVERMTVDLREGRGGK